MISLHDRHDVVKALGEIQFVELAPGHMVRTLGLAMLLAGSGALDHMAGGGR